MAPAAAVCNTVVQKKSQEPKQVVSGKRRLTLDSWASQPPQEAVRASSSSSSGGSCTTLKGSSLDKTLTLVTEDDEACSRVSACVTPKSKKHRIPVVDVDLCPPAPKKPRSLGRMQVSYMVPSLREVGAGAVLHAVHCHVNDCTTSTNRSNFEIKAYETFSVIHKNQEILELIMKITITVEQGGMSQCFATSVRELK